MGIINWIVQRQLYGVAKRMGKKVAKSYAKSKSQNPNAPEKEVIIKMAFDEEKLSQLPESSRKRIEICCETIQGFCYMMVLDFGSLKGWMNLRSLQFTHYMDRVLENMGFPPQSKEQKARILEAMELKIPNWDKITGD